MLSSRPLHVTSLLLLGLAACIPGRSLGRTAAVAEVKHVGFRDDIPDAARGNAVFEDAVWSRDGSLFVTLHHMQTALRVWNGGDGSLLSRVETSPLEEGWIVDGPSRRMIGRKHPAPGLVVYDLMTGQPLDSIFEDSAQRSRVLGLTDEGTALVRAVPGAIEVWQLHPALLRRSLPSPLPAESYPPSCVGGIFATYNTKRCWEVSPRGNWLGLAFTPEPRTTSASQFLLVNLNDGRSRDLTPAANAQGQGQHLASFAFSADERHLAIGLTNGIQLYDITEDRAGPFLPGAHQRNALLGAMGFSADGTRLVALGDQLQVSTFEVATGRLLGRHEPEFWDWEGIFRLSDDGSRVVIYHFVSDLLEVLDGADVHRVGWVCPVFCNTKHNPVPVAFAVSPDGRRVVASHRYGAGIYQLDTDRPLQSLMDPTMPAVHPR